MTEALKADNGSFKDPAGQVYRVMRDAGEASIVRGLNQSAAGIMEKLLAEPFFQDLVDGGQVVATRLLQPELPNARHVMKEGWAGRERPAFDARRSPDMVLCLALVHHLRVAANIPLRLFIDWLRSLDATCILEFVGRNDEMFQILLENKREDYADYTAENFESEVRRCFSVRDRLKLKGGLRELFLLEPADGWPGLG